MTFPDVSPSTSPADRVKLRLAVGYEAVNCGCSSAAITLPIDRGWWVVGGRSRPLPGRDASVLSSPSSSRSRAEYEDGCVALLAWLAVGNSPA